ncbi:MAG: hypothetical protein HYS15_01900 [Candidatus Spechtbacteria bacterium]|nr:hypothetical protein [Candidatus Spechtbacteria bacterium]
MRYTGGMKRTTRTFLFSFFMALFVVVTPVIIAYSQGYRIDFAHARIVETGALYLEPRPAPADLYLNGKLRKRSNVLFQNIFVSNLLPRAYHIEIKKEGYVTWGKNLSVSPRLVTELKNILLFKNQYTPSVIFQYAENFSLSPSKNKLVFVKTSDTPEMYLTVSPHGSLGEAGGESKESRLILKASNQFLNYRVSSILWNQDETLLLVALAPLAKANGEKNSRAFPEWMAINLQDQNPEAIDLTQLIHNSNEFAVYAKNLPAAKIDNLQWSKDGNSKIFFTVFDKNFGTLPSYLFLYDLETKQMSSPLAYDVLLYAPTEASKILYVSSFLATIHLLDQRTLEVQQVSFAAPAQITPVSSVSFIDTGLLLLMIDKNLYLLNLNEKIPNVQKLADEVISALVSSDKKRLLIATKDSLIIRWLRDVHVQPFHDVGESVSLLPAKSLPIFDALWLTKDNEHVLFSDQNSIKVTELDGRGERNTATLVDNIQATHLSYDESRDIVYYLARNTLYFISLK